MRHLLSCLLILSLGFVVVSCGDEDEPDNGNESENDTELDTGDAIDTEADRVACPVNSGYPCPCESDRDYCDDDSYCVGSSVEGAVTGTCHQTCTGVDDTICELGTELTGIGICGLEGPDEGLCILLCDDHSDCAQGTECAPFQNNPELFFCMGR